MLLKKRRFWLGLVMILVVIQFFRPQRDNPATDPLNSIWAAGGLPADVATILERSCADCHSHRTEWPWYSQIAPVSWLVARDVNEGRSHLNFSRWADYEPYRQHTLLEEICEEVEEGEMPLPFYTPLHGDAALSDADRTSLCDWTREARRVLSAELGGLPPGDAEEH
jgi:hypothetical protein